MRTPNTARLQKLRAAVSCSDRVYMLKNADGIISYITQAEIWQALSAAIAGQIDNHLVVRIMEATASNDRIVGLIRALVKSKKMG